MFWTKKEEVTEILKGASSSSTRIMVHLGTFLFTAFNSGSKVLTKCTSLKRQRGKKFLYKTWISNIQMWGQGRCKKVFAHY